MLQGERPVVIAGTHSVHTGGSHRLLAISRRLHATAGRTACSAAVSPAVTASRAWENPRQALLETLKELGEASEHQVPPCEANVHNDVEDQPQSDFRLSWPNIVIRRDFG